MTYEQMCQRLEEAFDAASERFLPWLQIALKVDGKERGRINHQDNTITVDFPLSTRDYLNDRVITIVDRNNGLEYAYMIWNVRDHVNFEHEGVTVQGKHFVLSSGKKIHTLHIRQQFYIDGISEPRQEIDYSQIEGDTIDEAWAAIRALREKRED